MNRTRSVQLLGALALLVLYAVAAHYSNSHRNAGLLGASLALAPLAAAALALVRRSSHPLRWLAPLAVGLVAVFGWAFLQQHYPLVYLAQQCIAYGVVAMAFAVTLLPGRVPLCTRIAGVVQDPLPPAVVRYTRQVTLAWAAFLFVMTAALFIAYWVAPLPVWSMFSNMVAPALVLLMFAVEALVRRLVLEPQQRAGMVATVRAYLNERRDIRSL